MKRIYTIGAIALAFAACKPNANITTPSTSGNARFTNYMAVGCSFTAGYADSSLTVSGQLNSYPQRLFEQFSTIQDGDQAVGPFILPLVTSDNGYPEAKFVLGTVNRCDGSTSLAPVRNPLPLDTVGSYIFNSNVNNNQVNNTAVPYLRVADMPVKGYTGPNVYARRFYYDATNVNKTPLDELHSRVGNLHPTFFTVWMGITDILGYAKNGGQGDGTGNALPVTLNSYSPKDITPRQVFTDLYDSIVASVSSTSAGGALLNIPYVTDLPLFTTIPINGLKIERQGWADTLVAMYANSLNPFRAVFQVSNENYYIITDHDLKVRQAVPGELILLSCPIDSLKCAGWGSTVPIPAKYVITTDELQHIKAATDYFNFIINKQAQDRNLALVDMNKFFTKLASGMTYNGIEYSTEYVSGGAFSLDGVHLTPRGNALVANEIIKTINTFYKSNIPMTDANKYPGIKFP